MTLIFVMLLGLVAGCLQSPDEDDDGEDGPPAVSPRWVENALPYGDGHDHASVQEHAGLSTPNFHLKGWDPLVTDHHGDTSGDYFCGGLSRGEQELAVVNSFNTDVAFVLVDVTDPQAPEPLGEFILKRAHTYDVDITPDGDFVVIATNPDPDAEEDPLALGTTTPLDPLPGTLDMAWRDACTAETTVIHEDLPLSPGTVLVDVRDPENPEFADFQPSPVIGPHSVHATKTADETDYVLASITNLVHQTSYFSIYTIDGDGPLGARLIPYDTITAQYVDPETESPLTNGHVDGWIATHPGTGQDLAYLANWNGGLLVAVLAGPGQAEVIGAWNDYDTTDLERAPGMTGQIHSALPMEALWDDKHYTIIGQEVGSRPDGRPTGQMIIMDTTDPSAPEPAARWTLPHDPGDWGDGESLLFSTHYPAVVNKTMFVSMYHAGVWAVDMDPAHWPELPTTGVYIPAQENPDAPGEERGLYADWTPVVLDVLATDDGDLVLWDGTSGVYVVAFDPGIDVPAPEPWTADAWLETP